MFKKLARQIKEDFSAGAATPMSKPISPLKEQAKKSFLKNLSKHALKLYERKTDINNFTKLVLSDPENTSHNELVDKLFEESLFDLSENERFLKDLGLDK